MSETERLASDGAMSIAKAVEFTGLGRTTLYRLMDGGKIAYSKIGRSRRIPRRELVRILSEDMRMRP